MLDAAAAALEREHGWAFDTEQVDLARSFVCDDRRVVVGVGPAGTGKTTAMHLAARALAADGRRLVAVAPSARAAAVLSPQIGVPATTLAKLLHTHTTDGVIHIESPSKAIYTLGDFFDEWHQPLSKNQVGTLSGAVTAFVNGKPWKKNPRDIQLLPHEDVQLQIGQPAPPIVNIDWSQTQL